MTLDLQMGEFGRRECLGDVLSLKPGAEHDLRRGIGDRVLLPCPHRSENVWPSYTRAPHPSVDFSAMVLLKDRLPRAITRFVFLVAGAVLAIRAIGAMRQMPAQQATRTMELRIRLHLPAPAAFPRFSAIDHSAGMLICPRSMRGSSFSSAKRNTADLFEPIVFAARRRRASSSSSRRTIIGVVFGRFSFIVRL